MTTDGSQVGTVQGADEELRAEAAIVAHHRELDDQVARRAGAVAGAVERGGQWEVAVADLVGYVADEVLPHARAEEHTLYRAAAQRAELVETVAAMTVEHGTLAALVDSLAQATDGPRAAAAATDVADLFRAHVRAENEIVLPALVADSGASLATLLGAMHDEIEEIRGASAAAEDVGEADGSGGRAEGTAGSGSDPAPVLLRLLLEATTDLARAGRGDQACRLAAAAWSVLRAPSPELAARVGPALHRLVRLASSEPVTFRNRNGESEDQSEDGARSEGDLILDVRSLVPAARHETIFAAFDALTPGQGFVLVNDHDPRPLRYQLEAEHPGTFTWAYDLAGPTEWRVHISRSVATAAV